MSKYQQAIEASASYNALTQNVHRIKEIRYGVVSYMLVATLSKGEEIAFPIRDYYHAERRGHQLPEIVQS